jgi:ribosomal protein S8
METVNFRHLEKIAETGYAAGKRYFDLKFKRGDIPRCSPGYISGACAGGHKFAAPFLCGKEYCQDCGKDGSPIHARRLARWSGLAASFNVLGYLVFTFPETVRFLFMDKKVLADYRYQLRRKLTRLGYKKGLARWHFFGDCQHCNASGCFECNNTGASKEFNPHLNVFIDQGYIKDLESFTADLSRWQKGYILGQLRSEIAKRNLLLEKYGDSISNKSQLWEELGALNVLIAEQTKTSYVINFSYTSDPKKITNRLKYVLRSTFRIYNTEIKENLHNFRNCIRWGFSKVEIQREPAEPIYCKDCKENFGVLHLVKWHKLTRYTNNLTARHYEEGIYSGTDASPTNPGSITIKARSVPRRITPRFSRRTY